MLEQAGPCAGVTLRQQMMFEDSHNVSSLPKLYNISHISLIKPRPQIDCIGTRMHQQPKSNDVAFQRS